jgi:archaellum biogenesis protein FlaJ (TadC family)
MGFWVVKVIAVITVITRFSLNSICVLVKYGKTRYYRYYHYYLFKKLIILSSLLFAILKKIDSKNRDYMNKQEKKGYV